MKQIRHGRAIDVQAAHYVAHVEKRDADLHRGGRRDGRGRAAADGVIIIGFQTASRRAFAYRWLQLPIETRRRRRGQLGSCMASRHHATGVATGRDLNLANCGAKTQIIGAQ